jgi:diketogulonate reductase-like aldo/keto reductase
MGARPRSFLATKVWTTDRERGIEQMRRSAQLLRAEIIDLMQIHNLVVCGGRFSHALEQTP